MSLKKSTKGVPERTDKKDVEVMEREIKELRRRSDKQADIILRYQELVRGLQEENIKLREHMNSIKKPLFRTLQMCDSLPSQDSKVKSTQRWISGELEALELRLAIDLGAAERHQHQSSGRKAANWSFSSPPLSPKSTSDADIIPVSNSSASTNVIVAPTPSPPPATTVSLSLSQSNANAMTSSNRRVVFKQGAKDPHALHLACLDGRLEEVIKLTDAGADINSRDQNEWTPLHCACSAGKLDIVEFFARQPAIKMSGLSAANNDANTPLHFLVRHARLQHEDIFSRNLELMILKGADVNAANHNGETPLHAACMKGNLKAMRLLMARGSQPNAQNTSGETPLHYAVRANSVELARELLRYGADPKLEGRNLAGTPLDVAQKANYPELMSLLSDPKYTYVPITLHSIGLEKYVPRFVAANLDSGGMGKLTADDLIRMEIPLDDRRKILDMTRRLRDMGAQLDLAALQWDVPWDDLKLEGEIGRGQFGVVWKARWKGKEVAVKQLRNAGELQIAEFIAELEILKKVRLHENIVCLMGVCKEPFFALVTEYLAMGSLDRLLPTLDLDADQIIRLARGACSGMLFLHQQNIIHRDIACRNLLVDKDAKNEMIVKLTDFGMSRFDNTGSQLNCGSFGPLKWMAPEALNFQYVKTTDLWSFAITLIEMFTKGADPYPSETPTQVAIAVRDHARVPSVPPNVPPELATLMKDCWKYNAEERPTAEEALLRIDQMLFRHRRSSSRPS